MTKANCDKHPFEMATTACHDCGHDVCEDCLVFARGPKKPPICLECSVTAAGVRSTAARPPKYVGREMRQFRRTLVAEFKEKGSSEPAVDDTPVYDPAAAMANTSWIDDDIEVPATEPDGAPAWKQSWSEGWGDEPAFLPGT